MLGLEARDGLEGGEVAQTETHLCRGEVVRSAPEWGLSSGNQTYSTSTEWRHAPTYKSYCCR